MRARSGLVLLFVAGATAATFGGCGLSGAGGGGGATSYDDGPAVTVTAAGPSGSTGPGGSVPVVIPGRLGFKCGSDSDCGGLFTCLDAASEDPIFGGGPAGGFCTKACDRDDDCPGSNSTCFKSRTSESGRCTLTCSIGPPLESLDQPLDAAKCLGRADLRCTRVKEGSTVCLPTCGDDAQCGAGRFCDPRLAVCVSVASAGLPTGAACDPSANPTTCAGSCVAFEDFGVTTCSSLCVLGGDAAGSLNCGGPKKGSCAFHPVENGPGDFGYCSPSCASHSECQKTPSFWCFSVPGFTDVSGSGYCFSATPCDVQSDCNNLPKGETTCTLTSKGRFCLDPAFPDAKP